MDLGDQTTAQITQEDGSVFTVPTTVLSVTEAAILGEYESWLSRERLFRKLYCRDCGMGDVVEVFVEPTQIGIACAHRLLFYQGPVPVALTNHSDLGETLIAPVRITIPDVPIALADAYLLRRYQKVLMTYGLREALWCLQCEDEGNASGIRAEVTPTSVTILCRHAHRVHAGFTL